MKSTERHYREVWSVRIGLLLFGGGMAAGCEAQKTVDDEEAFERVSQAIVTNSYVDNSVPGVHVQVKECTTDTAVAHPTIDCTLDAGYALAGGGAWAQYTGSGGLLTESRPLSDNRTWRASSKDHVYSDPHKLTAYAVGLRLDGINAATLRSKLVQYVGTNNGPFAAPGISYGVGPSLLGGGARAFTTGAGQLLTDTWPVTSEHWAVNSKDHLTSSPGGITVYAISLPTGIHEGFGALDRQQKIGPTATVSTGVATATSSVDSGWALAGYGATSIWDPGTGGRLLFKVGAQGASARNVEARSKDHGVVSGGSTRVYWTQVRKTPNSHGLCNTGSALSASMDSCVSSICQVDPFCCNNSWDSLCVGQVTSVCGRSCADHACQATAYTPSFWNVSGVQYGNNCYNYANNKRTDTFAQPGRAAGEHCSSSGCLNAATIGAFAETDGLIPTTAAGTCPDSRAKLALVIDPGWDYHWYRRDSNGMWTHKPGGTAATNLDNSGNPISNPETANRGGYTVFAGYYCSCSSTTEGQGRAVIN